MMFIAVFVICWGHGAPAMAAIEDRWFTVDDEEEPFVEGFVTHDDSETVWQGAYYRNDQTFFRLSYVEDMPYLDGSYLWDSGFFLGLGYGKANGVLDRSSWVISPGYRWDLDRGYLALSLDYQRDKQNSLEDFNSKISNNGLELSWVYYPDRMKIKTNLQWMKADVNASILNNEQFGKMNVFRIDPLVDFKVSDNLVIGVFGSYYHGNQKRGWRFEDEEFVDSISIDSHSLGVGLTWEHKGFIVNAQAQKAKGQDGENISTELIIPIGEHLQLGLEYYLTTNDYVLDNDAHGFSLEYRFKEDYELYLHYMPEDDGWELGIHRDL